MKTKSKSVVGRKVWRQLESNSISDCFSYDTNADDDDNNINIHQDDEDDDIDFFDCEEEDDDDIPFSFNANIQENILVPSTGGRGFLSSSSLGLGLHSPFDKASNISTRGKRQTRRQQQHHHRGKFDNVVQNVVSHCYQTCPGAVYSSSSASKNYDIAATTTATTATQKHSKNIILASSLLKRRGKKEKKEQSTTTTSPPSPTTTADAGLDLDEETMIQEPSPAILAGIIKPLIPKSIWYSLTGREFYYPSTISKFVQTSLRIAGCQCADGDSDVDSMECEVDWKPADSKTKKLLAENDKLNNGDSGDTQKDEVVRNALLDGGEVLVWMGKFMNNKNSKKDIVDEGYGSNLPLIKTISIIPLSPKKFAELLMDSDKVPLYNKMSQGRKDVVVFQQGVDTTADTDDTSAGSAMGKSFVLDGEAKIVRNISKPPLSKKLMEFVTLMYARRLNVDDNVSSGYVGSGIDGTNNDDGSYIVVTRAVSGGRWGGPSGSSEGVKARGGAGEASGGDEEEMIRSEILLGINVLRTIPGEPDKTEVTAVTHVYSPSVPTMLAGTVGVKGAIDFVKDIRALCK